MIRKPYGRGAVWLLSALLLLPLGASPARAIYGKKEAPKAAEDGVESKPTSVKLYDAPLTDQDGRSLKFRTDVLGDRIVVIDSFFTTCGQICPILSAILMDLQDQLGPRLGREVAIVSLTVDPVTDIPPRLKKYAESWNARPGWFFLTGGKTTVDQVLTGLGLYATDYTQHPSMILVGDPKSGEWTRFYGFASPEQLLGRVDELAAARKAGR